MVTTTRTTQMPNTAMVLDPGQTRQIPAARTALSTVPMACLSRPMLMVTIFTTDLLSWRSMLVIRMVVTECPTATETEHPVETQPHVLRRRLSAHPSSSVVATARWLPRAEACHLPQDLLQQKRRRRRVSSRSDSARVEKAAKKQYIRNDLMGGLGGG
jgi:hypothetical protein